MRHLFKPKEFFSTTPMLIISLCFGLLLLMQDLVAQTKPSFRQHSTHVEEGHSIADHKVTLKKDLTYGESLGLVEIPKAATWIISGPSGVVSGKGNALNDFVFTQAGNYEITLEENVIVKKGECHHSAIPSRIELNVSAVKMTFHDNELMLSSDIRKGVDTQGIVLSIPVTLETLGDQPLHYNNTTVRTAGIGTNIVAQLKAGTALKTGKQMLQYELSGVAQASAYIAFDFIDINGQVQSVGLKKQIQ